MHKMRVRNVLEREDKFERKAMIHIGFFLTPACVQEKDGPPCKRHASVKRVN